MILPTELLKTMVDEIIELKQHNTVKITFTIRNHQYPDFSIEDAILNTLIFDQDFRTNTTDKIQVVIDITPKQLKRLTPKQSDLYVDIVIEYVDKITHDIILDETPITLRYKALVHDLSNISKQYGINAFESTDGSEDPPAVEGSTLISLDMQLIGETEHKVNKSSCIGMIKDVNPEEIVKYASSVMGISKIKMVPPDNTTKYQHITIPPEQGNFRSLFDHLQAEKGIYANGFRHYISNGTLYVYPPFDMKSKQTPRLNVIRVSANTYVGSDNLFKVEDGELTIVSNTNSQSKVLSNVGSENDGNTKVFTRSDGMIDGQVKKGKEMSLTNVTASMSSRADNTITKGSAVAKYVKPTLNMFKHASSFSESNTEIMVMGWPNARIGMTYPGMPVTFIFDEKDNVMSKDGILESIRYVYTSANRHIYTCAATFMLRLDPTQEPYDA